MTDLTSFFNLCHNRYSDEKNLTRYYSQVYSQNGEDGMIAEIFRRIAAKDKFFVEIGVENGRECNTRFLLEMGWSGIWIEGDAARVAEAHTFFAPYVNTKRLTIVQSFITPDNIEAILRASGAPAAFDFLSLDIDQYTSHVWKNIETYRPRAICIEYNASIPPSCAVEVPYIPNVAWDGSNWFGAGLKAIEMIGLNKRFRLIGCDYLGVNAFLVSEDEEPGLFQAPFTAEFHYEPPKYHLTQHIGHPAAPSARQWVVSAEVPGSRES
jgi:hypothetical protein